MSTPSVPPPIEPLPPVPHLRLKAALLLGLMALLVCGSALYLLYARGAFERTQRLVLMADDSEGVVVGMDVTFAGFPIGRVQRTELGEDGNVRILVDVPLRDARWLRTSSVFTLERGLVGDTRIRAFSGMLRDPPLPDGAVRTVLRGDVAAEIPRLMASVRELLDNLQSITAGDAALNTSLANLRAVSEKLAGSGGVLQVLMGNEADAKKVLAVLERTNAVLARMDALAAHADAQVFGPGGVMPGAQASLRELQALLAEARGTLKKADAVLQEAQAIGANTREATADLGALRADVETSLRKVDGLINEINRKWPFARDTEVKLP